MKEFELKGVIFQIYDNEAIVRVNCDGFDAMICNVETARTIYKEIRASKVSEDNLVRLNIIIESEIANAKRARKTYAPITVKPEIRKSLAGGGVTYIAKVLNEDQGKVRNREMTIMEQVGWSTEEAIQKLNERYKYINVNVEQAGKVETYLNGKVF